MTRIYLVEDHPETREALGDFLRLDPTVTVCGGASNAATALEEIAELEPELVFIDVTLPDMSGIELTRLLRARHPELHLAVLSGHRERDHVTRALEAGASGYILKGSAREISTAIRSVLRGERYLSPGLET